MHAFKPMLAGQCKSFDDPGKKYGKGFYLEVKYDGERVQLHMANRQVKCFARSLKPTDAHKVSGLAEAVPRAFPGASSVVIDGEGVMKDAGGAILAFGAQGKHEQQKYAARHLLRLLVFDLLSIDGADLTHASQRDRRERLQSLLVPAGAGGADGGALASSADEVRVAFGRRWRTTARS